MAENIIRVIFEDSSSSDTQENTSPLNNTTTESENVLNSFVVKLEQSLELFIKNLTSQAKPNEANQQQSTKENPAFDTKTIKDFNSLFKDTAATAKQFKELNKTLLEFNKQLKDVKPSDSDNNEDSKPPKSISAAIAKTIGGGLPFYYATEAFRNYAATNALDYGNNLMNPLAYANQRRGLEYEQDKNIAGGIGAVIGAALGSIVPGIGTALGMGLGAITGSKVTSLGYSYFGGQDNAQDQLQNEVSQNYTNLKRGNALSQQLASMYGNTFNNGKAAPENMFLLPQFLQMGNMNQFGGNLSKSDLAGVAKISDRYNANPAQVGSLLSQINAHTKDMSGTLLNVDSHAQKTGGDIVSQLAVAVQLMQKGGLSAPDAINKAFNQHLYGVTYAGAQNNYFQSSYINQYRMRALGKIAGIDVEGIVQNEPKAIFKFNRLQTRAANNRLTPDASTLLINMIAQNLGLGNGTINANTANQGAVTPYNDIFKNLSNPETIQHKNYKSLGVKKPKQELYGEIKPHDSFKTSVVDKVVDKGKQSLTHVLAGQYVDNLRQMEADKKTGNMTDYQYLEKLNKNLELQIKALNKNTQALQQKKYQGYLLMSDTSWYNALGVTEENLQIFNGWDLQNALYNGVNFYIANPYGSGSITNSIDTINTAASIIGVSGSFPLNSSLPTGTKEYLQEIRDSVKRKLVIHPLLNTNTNIIEDMGFEVERFNGIGLIVGDSYYTAYSNLYNYFLARQGDVTFENILQEYRNVLNHPLRGKIENVFLAEFKVIHSSERFKGILFEFVFVAQEITTVTQKSQSAINQVNQLFNLIVSSTNIILTVIDQIESYSNMASTYFNTTSPSNAVNFTATTVPEIKNYTVPLLTSTATILYNNFRFASNTTNYTNYYFENQSIDYSKFEVLAPYANSTDDTTLNALLEIYNNNVQYEIDQINNYGLNIQANDLITALKNSYVNLLDLCKVLSKSNNSQHTSYVVPYTMSIRELCFNNNLDFNDVSIIQSIIAANPGKFVSVNKIPLDTVLLLPKS